MTTSTSRLWIMRRATVDSIPCGSLFGAHVVGEGEFVGARRVPEAALHRPGGDLVMDRNDRVVADGGAHRLARERLARLVVDGGETALEQLVDLGVRVARPVERAESLLRV